MLAFCLVIFTNKNSNEKLDFTLDKSNIKLRLPVCQQSPGVNNKLSPLATQVGDSSYQQQLEFVTLAYAINVSPSVRTTSASRTLLQPMFELARLRALTKLTLRTANKTPALLLTFNSFLDVNNQICQKSSQLLRLMLTATVRQQQKFMVAKLGSYHQQTATGQSRSNMNSKRDNVATCQLLAPNFVFSLENWRLLKKIAFYFAGQTFEWLASNDFQLASVGHCTILIKTDKSFLAPKPN